MTIHQESGLWTPEENLWTPESKRSLARTSFVLEGGGAAGAGYISGILKGMEDWGVTPSPREASLLGTSGGSIAASFAATGIEFEDVMDMKQFRWPHCMKPGFLRGMLGEVLENKRAPNVNAMVWAKSILPTMPRARMLNGDEYPLKKIAAASSAVPGVFFPELFELDVCVDGGAAGSKGHIKLAPEAENVIVVAPMATHFMPPIGQFFENMTIREMDAWREKTGGNVIYIRPNRDIASDVKSPIDIFRISVGLKMYEKARMQMHGILNEYIGDKTNVGLDNVVSILATQKEFTTPNHYEDKIAA